MKKIIDFKSKFTENYIQQKARQHGIPQSYIKNLLSKDCYSSPLFNILTEKTRKYFDSLIAVSAINYEYKNR
jgi:hypothetical protein